MDVAIEMVTSLVISIYISVFFVLRSIPDGYLICLTGQFCVIQKCAEKHGAVIRCQSSAFCWQGVLKERVLLAMQRMGSTLKRLS
jgi:hypothetical protein